VAIDDQTVDQLKSPPGFFLRMLELPAGSLSGPGDYATITIASDPAASDVAIEQFDAQQEGQIVFGFAEGWHEREYNPTTGKLWRWTSERAVLRVRAEGHALSLHMDGELACFRHEKKTFNADEVSGHLLQSTAVMSINWPAWIAAMDDPARSKIVGKIAFAQMPSARRKGVAELGSWLLAARV
jgi:hypothetical protein